MFSLGIVPYINASILLQLLATALPSLKKLQREEGPQGRARFQLYQKLAALVFAVAQAAGQLSYLRPYVDDFSGGWLLENIVLLTAGSMILVHVSAGKGGRAVWTWMACCCRELHRTTMLEGWQPQLQLLPLACSPPPELCAYRRLTQAPPPPPGLSPLLSPPATPTAGRRHDH